MDSMGNTLNKMSDVLNPDIDIDEDVNYKQQFNNVLTTINQKESTSYTLIYGINHDSIVTDGLWFNFTPNDVIGYYQKNSIHALRKYDNYYHIIWLDRYGSYYYDRYYINLKQHNFLSKPHIYNIQLVLDFYVINNIYNYINEVYIVGDMKQIMLEFNQKLTHCRNNDYITTIQHIHYFKTQMNYILIVLNSLLKKNNKKCLNHVIWINLIAPYLY